MPANADPQPYAPPATQGEELDLHAYWRLLRRRRWAVLGVLAAVVVGTLLVTLRMPKIYSATATLVIDTVAPKVLDKDQVQDVADTGGYLASREYYETQHKIIASRSVAQRVVERLQLAQNDRFLGIEGEEAGRREERRRAIDPVLVLQERLKVTPVKESRLVRVSVEDRDPQQAAVLANAVAEAYIADTLSVRSTTTQSASDWLEQQLADLEGQLEESGKALFEFKKSHDIVATSWEDRQSMVSQRLVAINDALSKMRIQRAQLEARNESIRAFAVAVERDAPGLQAMSEAPGVVKVPAAALRAPADPKDPAAEVASALPPVGTPQFIAGSGTIQQLKFRYLDTKIECADLETRYGAEHPRKQACDGKLATAKASLRAEIQAAIDSARSEYEETRNSERKLQALLDQTKSDAFAVNQYERDYLELKRTYDNNQRLYEMVLKRLKDASVTGMLQMSNVRILDRAQAEDVPTSPKPLRNLAVAALLGAVLGVALAFLLEQLDTSITTREQVEERLGLAFLGIAPSVETGPEDDKSVRDLFVHAHPTSAAAECLRSVRTNLLFMSPERQLKTILVTSSGPSEGKTTIAAFLAQVMADAGNRVLLVDADMRRPRVHQIFGLAKDVGLSSLILGEGRLEDAVHATPIPNLAVLPCGPIPPNPNELLHTANFNALLAAMAERYDRVIVDSPPAGVVADAVVASTQVDGTVVILKAGQTTRDAAARTIRALRDVKARVLGVVLNDLDLEDQRYGQYYQYYRYGYYAAGNEAKPKHA